MYDRELERVEKKIFQIVKSGRLNGKKVFLFGVSDNTRQIIQMLRETGITPQNVIDNDISKQHSYCGGIKVVGIQCPQDDKNVYIIYSAYWREMIAQLYHLGIKKRNILLLYRKPGTIWKLIGYTYFGKYLYKKLVDEYGDVPVFVCPYTGTGDIYLIGTFWEQYLKKNNIEDYVFVVITGACKKVANLCNIKNVHLVEKKWHVSVMLNYYMLCPEETKIKVLNDSWGQIHTNQIEWFRGYKGLYFTKLFKEYVFNLSDVQPKHPILEDVSTEIESIALDKNLIKGKTVILSPYSNTLSDLPVSFWEKIAVAIKRKGLIVCTNSSGKGEPAINGTIPVFFPLNIAPQFIQWAGYFIGVRSGFCDIISSSDAKKIILYDKRNRFYMGSAYEYFSLKDMGLADDVIEILYDSIDVDETYEMVMKAIDL
mgnify:CR=1 FL=1